MDSKEPEQQFVKSLTAKEIKKLAKPEFAANPDKFYPTATFRRLGFSRASCPECGNNYWRHSDKKTTCGDSQCEKKYSFIGVGTGIGRGVNGRKITYGDAWKGFERSLTSARIPCTSIKRYPVVARWRADVDFVAAGIFCFQPYCVTGELSPPANPLICPQFCLRFNDLDNIGLTGRHYSGFIMLGIQVFNKENDWKFWNEECVEFNYRWLTEELGIDPDEITFIEDVWAGGGNLGPSIEYFVNGLELGNMVFMQFKTFPDGSREPLQVKVIDVGIGLERVPWLINGSATSYMDVFPNALQFFLDKIGLDINADIWEKYGPLSCLLNVDEVDDLSKTWQFIADQVGSSPEQVKSAIEPIRDVYVVLDHTRCSLMAITDGSLPSNVGGAANVRNIIRRCFAILKKRGWWDKLGMDGFLQLFDKHRQDLATIYGPFAEYKSFRPIIELEYDRWLNTDVEQKQKLDKMLKKKAKLDLNDWITAVTSYGLPADTIAAATGEEIPGNLWYAIAELQERTVKAAPTVLYSTAHLPETKSLFYIKGQEYNFNAKILEVMPNVTDKNVPSIVILDQSSFYPTSGGQEHDTGIMYIDDIKYDVVDVMKVGPTVLHVLSPPLPINDSLAEYKGKAVRGEVDVPRREQLRNHHTATHIIFAACRRVLGPHVWQHGANKRIDQAHLDITHYRGLTYEEIQAIEQEANRIVQRCKEINKGFMPKDEAEKQYGFHLYQGGIVPGNSLRVVNIADTDTEACCGTHCDNTAEVGYIKIFSSRHPSDGIVRLYYVAGERALSIQSEDNSILNTLKQEWRVAQNELIPTAERFFEGYKKYSQQVVRQSQQIVDLQLKLHCMDNDGQKLLLLRTTESDPTMFINSVPAYADKLKSANKGVVFVADNFVYGMLGSPSLFDISQLQSSFEKLREEEEKRREERESIKKRKEEANTTTTATAVAVVDQKAKKNVAVRTRNAVDVRSKDKKTGKMNKTKVDNIVEFTVMNTPNFNSTLNYLIAQGWTEQSEE